MLRPARQGAHAKAPSLQAFPVVSQFKSPEPVHAGTESSALLSIHFAAEQAMLALAKLYMADGDTDACQNQCVALLRTYPENEEASVMLAELMFYKVRPRSSGCVSASL